MLTWRGTSLAENNDKTAHAVLALLGFDCSVDKESAFAPRADLLGVTVDLTD